MTQTKCKFCMQPSDKHLVGCPAYKTPEQRSKANNPFDGLFGDLFNTNTKGKK